MTGVRRLKLDLLQTPTNYNYDNTNVLELAKSRGSESPIANQY